MVETYKYKSKIANAAAFIAALIIYIGKDGLAQIIPAEYANWISIIIIVAGYIVAQTTEDKRVDVAEQRVYEQIAKDNIDSDEKVLNDEYECDEDDSCC